MYILLQSDATLFFGRFHSLTVHLPIGFLLLGAVLFLLSLSKKFNFLIKALPITLFLGAISVVVSIVLGFLLAEEGGYSAETIFWHRLMGIVVAILSIGMLFLILGYWKKGKTSFAERLKIENLESNIIHRKKQLGALLLATVICISITGHLGGNLTHGENYLYVYAPEFVQEFLLVSDDEKSNLSFPEDADSTMLFNHIIGPVLQQKCASCHNVETQKGGLMVTSLENLLKGGETGPALEEGAPQSSELYKRVTMDPSSKKFMPPKGAGLSYGEISILRYWIENGMESDIVITDEEMPEELQNLLESSYGLSTRKKAHYEKATATAVTEAVLDQIRTEGFRVSALSEENNFLEVVALGSITKENLAALEQVSEQITWLDLGGSGIDDSWLETISNFPNLTRLLLDNNKIGDQETNKLEKLEHLESINLFNTAVGDSTLTVLSGIKSLKSIYVWNTKVSKELVEKLMGENPKLKIDLGVVLEKDKPQKSESAR